MSESKTKVLVVDDHPLIREALRNVLAELDAQFELLESADSAGALRTAATHPDIDLVLLDLNLPDSQGFTTLEELRRRRPATAVVVWSAQHDHQHVACASALHSHAPSHSVRWAIFPSPPHTTSWSTH